MATSDKYYRKATLKIAGSEFSTSISDKSVMVLFMIASQSRITEVFSLAPLTATQGLQWLPEAPTLSGRGGDQVHQCGPGAEAGKKYRKGQNRRNDLLEGAKAYKCEAYRTKLQRLYRGLLKTPNLRGGQGPGWPGLCLRHWCGPLVLTSYSS